MRCLFTMWGNTRMSALVALSASLYAAAIVVFRTPSPFQARFIGQLIPMPISLLFGPAGAWGVVFGGFMSQLIAGEFQIGTVLALPSSMILGAIPYCLWSRLRPLITGSRAVKLSTAEEWTVYMAAAVASGFACAVVIAFLSDILGLAPFRVLAVFIGVQDAIQGCLSVLLFAAVGKRIEALGLTWWEVLDGADLDQPDNGFSVIGAWIVLLTGLTALPLACFVFPAEATAIAAAGSLLIVSGLLLMW